MKLHKQLNPCFVNDYQPNRLTSQVFELFQFQIWYKLLELVILGVEKGPDVFFTWSILP